ncbi:hypothetical protein TPHA_0E01140 [Tetrapisispora phaffii CBS 4417]|uniref:Cyclin N-terminal domain-containing protein n=1 Tax=Tetrapisispora phaffii (strain ATCC 24235 / CBS 4417 / NBRC 1672 / NRRL Y-8282 / UCD 70-5) TaxID=1071381 RepID=G8BTI0_TETPH|nr:hypothetical protein TPHA_0E01140 [Tetrapisispora phaffii CBS 4417]CCE63208.1 hypothetical protein TPHA_0E01140 [Tetrapisispora phaffii CBS 4417]
MEKVANCTPFYSYGTPAYSDIDDTHAGTEDSLENTLLDLTLENVLYINGVVDTVFAVNAKFNGKHAVSKKKLKLFLKEIVRRTNSKNINVTTINHAIHYLKAFYSQLEEHDCARAAMDRPLFTFCIKRMFIMCLVLANKFLVDENYVLSTWSLITASSLKDLKIMETYVLKTLDYNLFYSASTQPMQSKRSLDSSVSIDFHSMLNTKKIHS